MRRRGGVLSLEYRVTGLIAALRLPEPLGAGAGRRPVAHHLFRGVRRP
ncbi:hypothetical protein [Brevundimonas denitrificans]|nr:hypothetical protein [Brevundimonas denitrificans]